MNINQALKRKNELAGKLVILNTRISNNARWIKGNFPQYDLSNLVAERRGTMKELAELKTKISKASQPIVGKILLMAELKSFITTFRHLNVSKGLETNHYRGSSQAPIEYDAAISERERDAIVENDEVEIRALQDDIDHFNATTEID